MATVFTIIRIAETLTAPLYYLIATLSRRKRIPSPTNPILTTSATVLARKIRARQLTCTQVVSAFVERCKLVNPILNAIVEERYEDALADAKKVDQFLQETRSSVSPSQLQHEKPLLGVPITVKECCSVKGMKLSVGIKRYEKRKAAYNSDAVRLMLEAGAIPIAVTSTPAYSSWIETFNDIIGYTVNPYDSRKSCGGSSGGEAALIASAASVLGLGSDAGGSIRIPAAFCGIFGHKSSRDMVSTAGHATFFTNRRLLDMLAVGPLCRYAADLRLAMNVLSAGKLQRSLQTCRTITLSQIRVHHLGEYERAFFSVHPLLKDRLSRAATYFETVHKCSVAQINIAELQNISRITLNHLRELFTLALAEQGNPGQTKYRRNNIIKLLLKTVENNTLKRVWTMMDDDTYVKQISNLQTKLTDLLGEDGVLLIPTWSEAACFKYQSIWKTYNCCYDYFANVFDFASTAVPVGLDHNRMPLSIQVIAARNRDHLCLMVAEELETLFGGWIPPYASTYKDDTTAITNSSCWICYLHHAHRCNAKNNPST